MSKPNISAIKQNILRLYERNPEVVNNIPMLLDQYWHTFDSWDDDKSLYWNLSRVTRPASIDRRLRELRVAGLIELSAEREKEVYEAHKSERDMHSTAFDDIAGREKWQGALDSLSVGQGMQYATAMKKPIDESFTDFINRVVKG